MNNELILLYDWLCVNRLSLNVSKTNFVLFHAISKQKFPLSIKINNKEIEERPYIKYLGVLIDSHLTFKYHINELNKKIARSIGILYKLRPFVNLNILKSVYYAIVYPFLLYGVIVWGATSKSLLSPIFVQQKKIVRLLTFNDTFSNTPGALEHSPPLFYRLELLNIYDIFRKQLGKFVYLSMKSIYPYTLIQYIRADEVHRYPTRYASSGNIYLQYNRTSKYGLNSIQALGSRFWNVIPASIQDSLSISVFSKKIKKMFLSDYKNQ